MITLATEVEVKGKTPEQIIHWFMSLDNETYKKWHPEHMAWKTIKLTPNFVGSIIYFDEKIGAFRMKLTAEIVKAEPNRFLVFKLKGFMPIQSYLSLSLQPTSSGTKVIHEVKVGNGGIFTKAVEWFLEKSGLVGWFEKALNKHAQEEFKNLEQLI